LTVAEHLVDGEQFRGKDVIAAIDFHHTIIYAADATPGQRPTSSWPRHTAPSAVA
jgi:hypothetical protein